MAKAKLENVELQEFDSSAGNGAKVAEPVSTGNAHANRKADKADNKEPMPTIDNPDAPQTKSKAEVITYALDKLANANGDMMALYKAIEAAFEGRGQSGNEKASKSIVAKEDLDVLFGEDISEEFKEKAFTIFEAAVNAKVAVLTAELEEAFTTEVAEAVSEIEDALVEQLDEYLAYVAEQYVTDNKLAIESSIRNDIAESFIDGLKALCESHYIDMPEAKVDVAEELAAEVEELQAKLDEQIAANISLKQELDEAACQAALATVSEGLTATQREKLATLAEGVEFTSIDEFKSKVATIKESFFEGKKILQESAITQTDENFVPDEKKEVAAVEPQMAAYLNAVSRFTKK